MSLDKSPSLPTIKTDCFTKKYSNVLVNNCNENMILKIWDTPGFTESNNDLNFDYHSTDAIVMVY